MRNAAAVLGYEDIEYFSHEAREDAGSWFACAEVYVEPDDDDEGVFATIDVANLTDLARYLAGQINA